MTPKEYRAALIAVGLAPNDASRFFQTDERTTRRWAADDNDRDVPRAVAVTLRLMLRYKLSPSDVVTLMNEDEESLTSAPDEPAGA